MASKPTFKETLKTNAIKITDIVNDNNLFGDDLMEVNIIEPNPNIITIGFKINENNEYQDFFSAIKICKKKRIGPSRTEDNRAVFYKKDISLLARNGFDFETSKRVMDLKKDDYLKIISLI